MSLRRLVFYLVAGIVLAVAGVVLMFLGSFRDNHSEQIAGIMLYGAAMPLLFQAKVAKIESRLSELERELANRGPEI